MILVVDDDKRLRTLLMRYLERSKFKVKAASNVPEARAYLALHNFNLIILDVMMSPISGIQFLEQLRNEDSAYTHIPVLMLTAQDSLDDKLLGFNLGADDYLTKPFAPLELVARIKILLKRHSKDNNVQNNSNFIEFGPLCYNLDTKQLYNNFDGNKDLIVLSSTQELLLATLAAQPNHCFSRSELAQKIGFRVTERSIDVQINRLRSKLGTKGAAYLKTIRHVGYTLHTESTSTKPTDT